MNRDELNNRFRIYLDQFPILVGAKAYWSLLHLLIIIPDICSAIESDDGRSTRSKYKEWVKKYVKTPHLNEEEWWFLRCSLLHQGKTNPNSIIRYTNISFSQPDENNNVFHANIHSDGSLNLDVGEMLKEIKKALDGWFDYVANNPTSEESINVSNNIDTLVQARPINVPFGGDISGLRVRVSASPVSRNEQG